MSLFSEQLRGLIQERGLKIYAFAAGCGTDRTLIHKILKGDRLPADRSVVEKFASVLLLDPKETERLMQNYKIARMGERVYARRRAVSEFFANVDPPTPCEEEPLVPQDHPRRILSGGTVYGKLEVNYLVKTVLEEEASRGNGRIQVLAQPEYPFLLEQLALVGIRHRDLCIQHIICLENSLKEKNSIYNLNCLRSIMPIIAAGCKYSPWYYYDSVGSHFGNTCVMPYLILTRSLAVTISSDGSCAAVFDAPEYRELYRRVFNGLLEKSSSLTEVFHHPLEQTEYYIRMCAGYEYVEYDFMPDPCLLFFADREMFLRYLSPELAADKAFLKSIPAYFKHTLGAQRMRNIKSVYFSDTGLRRFLSVGRITEIPDEYYTPLSLPDRYLLLRRMYEAALKGDYHPVLIDSKKLKISENLCTYLFRGGAACFVYAAPGRDYTVFSVTEKSIFSALQDFFSYLPESGNTFSEKETLSFLKNVLESGTFAEEV
ncbi:protein of unknown function [Ruminococcaceae bacterium BL-6]|nr:protein of unknown function [Ruminococcaceae bacterium BL-6]